jgi:16S rRNA (guanine527-N7)-methyltransferase
VTGPVTARPEPHRELTGVLEDARRFGFLGPGPIDRQHRHAADLARAIGPFAGRFLDLGSGGGLPGLVLVDSYPGARATLLDSQQRRCDFLRGAVERLDLEGRVEVACGRAESLARDDDLRGVFDLVVARSFGPPPVTAECAVGFLRPGGALVATEPPDAEPRRARSTAVRWPEDGLHTLRFGPVEEIRHGDTGAIRTILESTVDERWPRREGVPGKRPLW